MINRTLVRTKVVQTLFAYYKDGDKTPLTAKKELLKSFSDTYDLYVLLLDFVNELTLYAEQQIQQAEQRAKVTHQSYVANRRFANNRLAQVVFNHHQIRNYLANQHLNWDAGMSAVSAVYKLLLEAPFYQEYMEAPTCDYEADKRVWRKIFTDLMTGNPAVESALEEMEVVLDRQNWTVDADLMMSFAVKTLKRLDAETGADQDILPMFDKEEELSFAKELLRFAIEEKPKYEALIDSHLRGWDAQRIAYMDRIILQVALAEIFHFEDIALEVSLNEYIELSKEYSSDKSYMFVNGVLTEILRDLKREGTLVKALVVH